MTSNIKVALYYLIAVNLLTFVTYGIDKWKARKNHWRVREATLLLLAVLGGSIGALLAMKVFQHKTLHKKFRYGIPAILLVELAAVVIIETHLKTECDRHRVGVAAVEDERVGARGYAV